MKAYESTPQYLSCHSALLRQPKTMHKQLPHMEYKHQAGRAEAGKENWGAGSTMGSRGENMVQNMREMGRQGPEGGGGFPLCWVLLSSQYKVPQRAYTAPQSDFLHISWIRESSKITLDQMGANLYTVPVNSIWTQWKRLPNKNASYKA